MKALAAVYYWALLWPNEARRSNPFRRLGTLKRELQPVGRASPVGVQPSGCPL